MRMKDKLAQHRESERRNAANVAAYRGASWKQKQIHALAYTYGRRAEDWQRELHGDDRDVYCRVYAQMMTGLRSLPAAPDLYVRVAMGEQLRKDRAVLDRIARTFERAEAQEATGGK